MLKHILPSLVVFAILLATVTANKDTDLIDETTKIINQLKENMIKLYPECGAKYFSNETEATIAECFQPEPALNVSKAKECCMYWEEINCARQVLWNINECKPLRLGNDLSSEMIKHSGKICDPATYSCPIAPPVKPVVKEIVETIMLSLNDDMMLYKECATSISGKFTACLKPFDPLLYKRTLKSSDPDLCDSEWKFCQCFEELINKEKKCEVAKEDFEGALQEIKENITKKGCPKK